eukprot:4012554-Amphidinium_carterae.1
MTAAWVGAGFGFSYSKSGVVVRLFLILYKSEASYDDDLDDDLDVVDDDDDDDDDDDGNDDDYVFSDLENPCKKTPFTKPPLTQPFSIESRLSFREDKPLARGQDIHLHRSGTDSGFTSTTGQDLHLQFLPQNHNPTNAVVLDKSEKWLILSMLYFNLT